MKSMRNRRRWLSALVGIPLLLAILMSSACGSAEGPRPSGGPQAPSGGQPASGSGGPIVQHSWSGGNIGLSAGGAKDINNFRENLKNRYLPLPTDITYEGLFYDYFFETGHSEETNKLFSPAYAYAVSKDPFSGATEYYLSVGLNSGMKESDFARKKLNLVIVLDISDSMNGNFNSYYYDPSGGRSSAYEGEGWGSKVSVAKDTIVALLDHLNSEDRVGIVAFNDRAYVAEKLNRIWEGDTEGLKRRILNIGASGSTNLSAGMVTATDLLRECANSDPSEYENRIIFLTDAMPNTGDFSENGLLGIARNNAKNRIYSTFIGVGVDFNSDLADYITKTKGANYYSVHTPGEFRIRMVDEFDYMVTPLVFDVKLALIADGWDIEQVYGSPEADAATGELMRVNTFFPSKNEGGEVKGGLILLKLRKRAGQESVRLIASYEDRTGRRDSSEATITLGGVRSEYFENDGVRKGILLARYASLLKNWLTDERQHVHEAASWQPRVCAEWGIPVPDYERSTWERTSLPLTVSRPYRGVFADFSRYFRAEMQALGDSTLTQEEDILDYLAGFSTW